MELRNIETFLRVVMTGSYTRAAQAMGLSQPTVSARIGGLEGDLGQRLFERRGNTMVLSHAGEVFRPYAEALLQVSVEAHRSLLSAKRPTPQVLRIGANSVTASGPLPEWMRQFRQRRGRSGVHFHVYVDRTQSLMQELRFGTLRLAFVNRLLAHPNATALFTAKLPMCLVVGPGHPLAGRTARMADLVGERLVSHESGVAAAQLGMISKRLGEPLHPQFKTNSSALLQTIIRSGEAIGLLAAGTVATEVAAGAMHVVPLVDFEPEPLEVSLVRWGEATLSGVEAAFVRELRMENRKAGVHTDTDETDPMRMAPAAHDGAVTAHHTPLAP